MTEDNVVGPWVEENPVECVLLVQRGSGPVPEVRRATTDDVAKAMGTTPAEVLRVQLDAEKDVTERFMAERNEARDRIARAELEAGVSLATLVNAYVSGCTSLGVDRGDLCVGVARLKEDAKEWRARCEKAEAWARRLNEDAEKAQRHLGEERRQCAERFTRTCDQLDAAKAEARRASDRADQLYRAIGVPSFSFDKTTVEHAMWLVDGTDTKATTIIEAIEIARRTIPVGEPISAYIANLHQLAANGRAEISMLRQQLEDAKRSNENLSRAFKSEQQCNANLRRGISELNCIEAHLRDLMGAKAGEPTTEAVRRIVASKEGT